MNILPPGALSGVPAWPRKTDFAREIGADYSRQRLNCNAAHDTLCAAQSRM
jgi:hypothetical protein